MRHCFRSWVPAVWELCSGISKIAITIFQMLLNEIGPLVSEVIPLHKATLFFHLPLFASTFFASQKPSQVSVKTFLKMHKCVVSITRF